MRIYDAVVESVSMEDIDDKDIKVIVPTSKQASREQVENPFGKVLHKVGFANYKYAVMELHAHLGNDYVKLRGAI